MSIENIAVIGVGGVGGYFGGKLCRVQGGENRVRVSFVARGDHLRAIQQDGLMLNSEADGLQTCIPFLATDDFERLPLLDLCLVCVKEFDLQEALLRLRSSIGSDTIVLPLLNGVDIPSRIRKVISDGIVLPACVYVGTHIAGPGRVVQKGGACRILFGPDPLRPDFQPQDVLNIFRMAGINADWTVDVQSEIWKKFVFICAYGLVTAASGKTLGQILDDPQLRGDVIAIMSEIVILAGRKGIRLSESVIDESLLNARSFPYEAKTSFQRDFERRNQWDERELFVGAMATIADASRVEIPRIRAVASRLEAAKPARPASLRREVTE